MTTTTTTNYSVANDASNLTILERLLATYKQYRQSPAGLSDIDT
jgi:hypothetical protein